MLLIVKRLFAVSAATATLVGCSGGQVAPSGGTLLRSTRSLTGAPVVIAGRAPAFLPKLWQETQIYAFQGNVNDGATPYANLLADSSGAFYGTTVNGGAQGSGAVFKLTPSKSGFLESILYSFQWPGSWDGANPYGPLIKDETGALYGTTQSGNARGASGLCLDYGGCGIVFKLTPSGSGYTESILYSFQWGKDGAFPSAGLLVDKKGALYGTTLDGGRGGGATMDGSGAPPFDRGYGTVFKLTRSGSGYTESILHVFGGGSDGANPTAALIMDGKGALFGTTTNGGGSGNCNSLGCGAVFKLSRSGSSYKESVLYGFRNYPDGANPYAALVFDGNGALYGTTASGGHVGYGLGTVFKLTPSPGGYTESTIHWFHGNRDGAYPHSDLIIGASGALYGTTTAGGTQSCKCGMAFELVPGGMSYTEHILYQFTGGFDGAVPSAGFIADNQGMLYGTTSGGGNSACNGGCGTVFKLSP